MTNKQKEILTESEEIVRSGFNVLLKQQPTWRILIALAVLALGYLGLSVDGVGLLLFGVGDDVIQYMIAGLSFPMIRELNRRVAFTLGMQAGRDKDKSASNSSATPS